MAEPVRQVPVDLEWEPVLDVEDLRYGWRWRSVRLPSGREVMRQIPLTPEDHLNPQYGDEVPQNEQHAALCTLVHALLKKRFDDGSGVLVTLDMIIQWGIEGVSNPSPDLTVIPGARPNPSRKTFEVREEGFRPCLVIEVVSDDKDPKIRSNDYEKKVEIYRLAGVPEYLILEPPFNWRNRLLIKGYVLGPDGRYREIEPDSQGRLLSRTTDLLFGVAEDGRTPVVIDARTGTRLLSLKEEEEARKAAEEQARLAEEQTRLAQDQVAREVEARKSAEAETAKLREELERLRKRMDP